MSDLRTAFNGLAETGVSSPIAALTRRYTNNLPEIISRAGAHGDHILIGDTDHSQLDIHQRVASPDVLKALAENGISKIFIERDQTLQNFADQLYQGEIDRDQFIDRMSARMEMMHVDEDISRQFHASTADLILGAKGFGMEVYFADPGVENLKFPSEIIAAYDQVFARYLEENGISQSDSDEYLKDPEKHNDFKAYAVDRIVGIVGADRYQELMKDWIPQQRLDDTNLAKFINEKSGGEPVAVFYGSSHMQTERGIDELLEGRSIRIDLYSGTGVYAGHAQKPHPWQQDPADIIYRIDTDEAFGTAGTNPGLAGDLDMAAPSSDPSIEASRRAAPALAR